ncbi:septation protein A [Gallibacterium genomosp. 1]|uniref:Inner membrane-spanning protein YciB n=1 Tax=Gallibacterium genomosp. 1 TaxID=155515 RepID=A0AB36DZ39_9PAST|nr:septation protein A [Gallibacterium genomosp. 1]OBX03301.1 septation protein A [Gallibacterium genomosp. 1]OBX03384.1 septation protein A [Gallibacterium genomosp. 1]
MKQLLEFIPLILFFAVYKFFGVREAAITLIIATMIQFAILKIKYGKIEKSQWIMAIAIIFFGSLTAYFNDLEFLKWKVTIVYALFALILLISQFGFKKLLIKSMLGKEIELPQKVWENLNLGWGIFFIICMLINIYVSLFLSDDIWVDFKSFGFFGLTLAASLLTGVYIYPHLAQQKNRDEK